MTVRLALLAVLALPACVEGGEEMELGVSLTRAEIHVDPSQPDALAEPTILLDVYGGARNHYISVDGAWLTLDDGISQRLDLTLDEEAINILPDTYSELALVNRGTRNSELVALCARKVPITVWVNTPGFDADGAIAPARGLSVACP